MSCTPAASAATLGAEEWGFSMEEMDSMERNAAEQLAARRLASPLKANPDLLARALEGKTTGRPPVSPMKRSIRLNLSRDGASKIAAEAPYNPSLIAAYKLVPGHEWDRDRKLWLFPEQYLQDLVRITTAVPDLVLDIQAVPPLVLPTSASQITSSSNPSTPQSSPAKAQDMLRTTNMPSLQDIPRIVPSDYNSPSKELVVKIYLMPDNRIAARAPYNENVKQVFQCIPGKLWNADERIWTFPSVSLMNLLHNLRDISFPRLKIEVIPPLSLPSDQSPGPSSNMEKRNSQPSPMSQEPPPAPVSQEPPPPIANLSKRSVRLFLHASGLIAVKCQPSQKLIASLKSIPKAVWNPKEKVWMFPPRFIADAEKTLAALDEVSLVESIELLVRRALDFLHDLPDLSGYYFNIPENLESRLLPFQREGVRFGLQHGGRVLIADEMGLGKTLQAIALASCVQQDWPVLVIVPSSLRIHWATMLKTWLNLSPSDITVVFSQGGGSRGGFTIAHSAGKNSLQLGGLFNIVSYDSISKIPSDKTFKVVVADESHYMKNAQAKRTNACVPLIQKSRYAVLLTGTPALSRPIELFKQLEALQPQVYRDVHEYGKRYCTGSYFGLYQGASNHEELHALLKSTVMIRRLKSEVLSELPEKCREQVFLSLDAKDTRQLRVLLNELKGIRERIQISSDDQIDKLKHEEKVLITKIYTESAVVKLPAVQDYLSTMLEANCKFLVFAFHHSMLDGIEDHFKKKKVEYIRIDGDTPQLNRQNFVTKFQESDEVRAAVLSIRAAGVGLTLTAASTVIFAEMTWTPGDMVQAEDRAHRIGQKSCVNVYYLHAQDTIDDFIWDSIHRKLENLGQVLNGREEKMHVSSPPQQRQRTLYGYLRPCSRNLSEQYDREAATSGANMDSEFNARKRLKLTPDEGK